MCFGLVPAAIFAPLGIAKPKTHTTCTNQSLNMLVYMCRHGWHQDVSKGSNVVWTNATWADDGTGQMPIGNGDITASVWVSAVDGSLRILMGKSDAFDENSQPVKVGVMRVAFDPPLCSSPSAAGVAASFEQELDLSTATITIKTADIAVLVYVDANSPVVRVEATAISMRFSSNFPGIRAMPCTRPRMGRAHALPRPRIA